MVPSRQLAILAAFGAAAGLAAAQPAAAQAVPHHGAAQHHAAPHGGAHHGGSHHGARPSHLHGTASQHVTPKRQHLMQQQRAARGDPQSADTDRLNSMSLQRAQGGAAPAAGAAGTTAQ